LSIDENDRFDIIDRCLLIKNIDSMELMFVHSREWSLWWNVPPLIDSKD
jgi:hypothetical protein